MQKLIGITVGIKSVDESLWVNGIKLNAAILYLLINRIDGYKAILVDTSGNVKDFSKIEFWDTSKFITKPFSEVSKKLDLLIQLGTTITDELIVNLRKNGFKAVKENSPRLYFTNGSIIKNRRNFQKSQIKKNYPDVYDESLTEKEMAEKLGFFRLWGTGTTKWVYDNENLKK